MEVVRSLTPFGLDPQKMQKRRVKYIENMLWWILVVCSMCLWRKGKNYKSTMVGSVQWIWAPIYWQCLLANAVKAYAREPHVMSTLVNYFIHHLRGVSTLWSGSWDYISTWGYGPLMGVNYSLRQDWMGTLCSCDCLTGRWIPQYLF